MEVAHAGTAAASHGSGIVCRRLSAASGAEISGIDLRREIGEKPE